MLILDSNVWIAFFNLNDSQHKKAERIFRKTKEILLPEYIFLEVASVLLLKAGKEIADKFVEFALNNEDVEILNVDSDIFEEVVSVFLDYSGKDLSFVDISLLVLAKDYPVVTFDKSLEKAVNSLRNRVS